MLRTAPTYGQDIRNSQAAFHGLVKFSRCNASRIVHFFSDTVLQRADTAMPPLMIIQEGTEQRPEYKSCLHTNIVSHDLPASVNCHSVVSDEITTVVENQTAMPNSSAIDNIIRARHFIEVFLGLIFSLREDYINFQAAALYREDHRLMHYSIHAYRQAYLRHW